MKELEKAIQSILNDMSLDEVSKIKGSLDQHSEQLGELIRPLLERCQPELVMNWGQTVTSPDDMEMNTIYLDGSCRGFHLNHDKSSVSFDHHTGCVRSITKSTCEQVYDAIRLGFKPYHYKQIVIDDIDADTVVSVWLLNNFKRVLEDHLASDWSDQEPYQILNLVRQIGFIDTNGVGMPVHELHQDIQPEQTQERSESLFKACYERLDGYIKGQYIPSEPNERLGLFYGFTGTRFERLESTTFPKVYEKYDVALAIEPVGDQHIFTLGKKSEFVRCDFTRIFHTLGQLELDRTDSPETLTKNWGGGSTIGGSARYSDNSHSRLPVELVLDMINAYFSM